MSIYFSLETTSTFSSTTPNIFAMSYQQLLKNNQKIRNLLPFCCKLKSSNKNLTKQKKNGFPMSNFISNTYTLKKNLEFYNQNFKTSFKIRKKFHCWHHLWHAGFWSCPLTNICDQLHETSKKINVVKPDDYKFESFEIVRDDSKSTSTKNVYKKDYKSANIITFQAMEQEAALFGKAIKSADWHFKRPHPF